MIYGGSGVVFRVRDRVIAAWDRCYAREGTQSIWSKSINGDADILVRNRIRRSSNVVAGEGGVFVVEAY